jgi:hypothetical protein
VHNRRVVFTRLDLAEIGCYEACAVSLALRLLFSQIQGIYLPYVSASDHRRRRKEDLMAAMVGR